MEMVTVIGRGHSGTRVMSHTLSASGVFMGTPLNVSGDLLPALPMYDACRFLARHVEWKGDLTWNWDRLFTMDIPAKFTALIKRYLASVLASTAPYKGWKIPETTLVLPWIVRMFPDIKYIFWIRDPRDCIVGSHVTDDLRTFGVEYPPTDDMRLRRAISWNYQYGLVKATPKPQNWIEVRFEDFVTRQDETLARLEKFLGLPLAKIPVKPSVVGRWEADMGTHYFDFLDPAMKEYGYEHTSS
jgi:hypothetical protein